MTDDYIIMHNIINELEKDPPKGVEKPFLNVMLKLLRKMTPAEFDAFISQEIRFTADEVKKLIEDNYYFYESELHDIMDSEVERDMEDMDTDLVDVCACALVNHLYLED